MPPVVIAAAVTATAAVAGASIASKGAQKGAQTVANATQAANDTNLKIFNQQRADAEPWRQMGLQALGRMGQLYGFSPSGAAPAATPANQNLSTQPVGQPQRIPTGLGARQPRNNNLDPVGSNVFALGAGQPQTAQPQPQQAPTQQTPQNWLAMDPGYDFRMKEGARALNTMYAARGMIESGDAAREMQRYGQNFGSNEFNNAYNRLAALAGVGQTVNQQNNQLGMNYANQTGQNLMNAGQAKASSYAQQGNIWGNAIGTAAGAAANVWSAPRWPTPMADPSSRVIV